MKVSACPRVKYVKEEFDLETIISDPDFFEVSKEIQKALHAPKKSVNEWLKAAMQGETSCGRDQYGQQQVCHACYASRLDKTESNRKYNSSDKGKSRLAAYRSKKNKAQPESAQNLIIKRNAELSSKLGCTNNIDLSCLTKKQAQVFAMYYGIGRKPMTLEAIAKKFCCKKQNVAQVRNYAVKNLLKQSQTNVLIQ
ncbi:MAG: hypothetical protein V7L20_15520 [Nostoc sp.]|uniref:hypothetical protein n=1 Tax=Nostoc sp. TaxID=1180 RepID=UPI002FFCF4A0